MATERVRARGGAPREYAVDENRWRDGEITSFRAAEVVRLIAVRLVELLDALPEGVSRREFSKGSGVGRATIDDLIAGRYWPDIRTICRLEDALGAPLLPDSSKPGEI